jgi:hypothetical protein
MKVYKGIYKTVNMDLNNILFIKLFSGNGKIQLIRRYFNDIKFIIYLIMDFIF